MYKSRFGIDKFASYY